MKDFSKDILHTIEEKGIAPRPRWVFFMRQCAFVGGFVLSVLIGGISVSIILFSLSEIDMGAERMIRMHPVPFLMAYLPYVWVLMLVVFGILAYYDMRNIKGAYRFRTITLLGASILASVIVGGLLHTVGAGKLAERRFADAVPQYEGLDVRKMHLWMHPQEGMLAGSIVSGSATSTFMLEDFSGMRWTVESADATVHGPVEGISGERVKVGGAVVAPGVFHATDIFPWTRRGPSAGPMNDMMQGSGRSQEGMLMHERNPLAPSY